MRVLTALLALAALPALAQSSRLEGRVITLEGNPVPKAAVRVSGRATGPTASNAQPLVYVEVTSADGRFTVDNIAPGLYTVTAQRTGYTTPTAAAVRLTPITVAAGETRSGVEVKLVQSAIVSGIVTDAEGDPVQGIQVRLLRRMYTQGRMALNTTMAASTDDRGQFRMTNVQEGRYYLAATPTAQNISGVNEIRGRSAQEANQSTYYPNSPTVEGAAKLDIKSASIETLQIRLRRGANYSIRGTVEMPTGASNSVQIQIFSGGADSNGQVNSVAVRPTGQFESPNLPPGSYTLFARYNVPATTANLQKTWAGRADAIVRGANVENVSIRLTEGGEIAGRLSVEGYSNITDFFATLPNNNVRPAQTINAGGQVTTVNRLARPAIILLSAENLPSNAAQTQVGEDGTFRVSNVLPMKYTLTVNNIPPMSYLKSARIGGQDVTRSIIDFTSGVSGAIEIVLSTKPASLAISPPASLATLTPAQSAGTSPQGLQATIWPAIPDRASQTGGIYTAFLNTQGAIRIPSLAPGDYLAVVWEESPPQDIARIPDFLARFNDLASKVTLREGETGSVEPRLISREALQKILTDFQ